MNKINIKMMSPVTFETLKKNIEKYEQKFKDNPSDPSWINSINSEAAFETKKFQVDDFELKVPNGPYDRETDLENAITLYEHLNTLPGYVLSEPRFWLWVMFEKGYEASLKGMEKVNATAFKHQWLFTDGLRRGLFFGLLSRLYFRVELTYAPENKDDPYYLTRYIMENPNRFREISWRTISNYRFVVKAMVKAEMTVNKELDVSEKGYYYTELAKEICKLGSIKLIDAMEEDEIEKYVYSKYKRIVESAIEADNIDKYNDAIDQMSLDTDDGYKKAITILTGLNGFMDSKELIDQCNEKLRKNNKKGLFSSLFEK